MYSQGPHLAHQYIDSHVPLVPSNEEGTRDVSLDDALLIVGQVLEVRHQSNAPAAAEVRRLTDPDGLGLSMSLDKLSEVVRQDEGLWDEVICGPEDDLESSCENEAYAHLPENTAQVVFGADYSSPWKVHEPLVRPPLKILIH